MLEALTPLILMLAQLLLGQRCDFVCETEGVVEHHANGTWYGAITADEPFGSIGLWVGHDGVIKIDDTQPWP